MSMTNLLPWRQQRRVHCLRFWSVLFVATLLLALIASFSLRMYSALSLQGLQSELAGVRLVQQVLTSRQRQVTQPQMATRPPLRLAWQPVLETLSRTMPSQVWLTELRYQPPSLMLNGYATALPDLAAMRDVLHQLAGFTPGPTGELQQDSQGRWMFTFQLTGQG